MRWSLPIARVFGIDLKVHATFVIILAVGALNWSHHGVAGMAFGAGLMALLFVCVTLHEFGHALVAQRLGIGVREVVLLPIGGVAVLARNPDRPMHELLIAAAGPLVNVAIAVGLWVALAVKLAVAGVDPDALRAAATSGPGLAAALTWLLGMNVALVLFNLIPAFPLDGGRILRAVLGFFTDWSRATRIATRTGQVIAIGLFAWALMAPVNVALMLIAVLIFLGAGATRADERVRTVLTGWRAGDAYNRRAVVLAASDTVGRVADYLLTGYQPDFAVMDGRVLVGVVTREQVLRALVDGRSGEPVRRIVREDYPLVHADTPLDEVRRRLVEAECRVAGVYDGGGFLGLVSLDDIAEAHAVLTSMGHPAAAAAAAARAAAPESGPPRAGTPADGDDGRHGRRWKPVGHPTTYDNTPRGSEGETTTTPTHERMVRL